jgi:FMN-dependent NADH-azoreductase
MSEVLFLECSPHANDSLGSQQVRAAIGDLESGNPGIRVSTRHLALDPIPPVSAQYAHAITSRAAADSPAFAWSERLIGELERSDALLISTPMHNYATPAALKLWIDHVLRKGRSIKGRDRPALVLVRSGSFIVGENAWQPDFLTPYLRHVLSVMGIHSVQFEYMSGEFPSADALAQVRSALASFLDPSPLTGDPA